MSLYLLDLSIRTPIPTAGLLGWVPTASPARLRQLPTRTLPGPGLRSTAALRTRAYGSHRLCRTAGLSGL